jgi:hypothetical protein
VSPRLSQARAAVETETVAPPGRNELAAALLPGSNAVVKRIQNRLSTIILADANPSRPWEFHGTMVYNKETMSCETVMGTPGPAAGSTASKARPSAWSQATRSSPER